MTVRRRTLSKSQRAKIARLNRDIEVTSKYGLNAHYMCGRKAAYWDEGQALGIASLRMAAGAPELRAYECPYCGNWHLTHKDAGDVTYALSNA